jgi:fructose-specific phosphotransferase system IIA component
MLSDAVVPGCVFFDLAVDEKENVLREMIDRLCKCSAISACDTVVNAVLERERERSTGIERGLAVPHCRTSAVDHLHVALAIVREGIDWGSLDGKPVHFIFLVVGPDSRPEEYLKLLSQISRLMKSDAVREQMINSRDAAEIVAILNQD